MKTHDTSQELDDRGIRCRDCGCRHFRVIYTRRAFGEKLIRRRECRNCGRRYTTWERVIGQTRNPRNPE